jgi:hypothetical protein
MPVPVGVRPAWRAAPHLVVVRLLRHPGGFEGLFQRVVLMDPRDLAVTELEEGGELDLHRCATPAPDTPLPTGNEDAIAGLDVVEVLDVILAEGIQPLPQVPNQAVPPR